MFVPPPGLAESFFGGAAWLAGLVALAIWFIVRAVRRASAKPFANQVTCRACRYELKGATGARCPECGADLTKPKAIRHGRAPRPLTWPVRIAVMLAITWFPLVGTLYVMYVNEAIHVWCFQQWSQCLGPPASGRFGQVIMWGEWCTVAGFRSGEVHAVLESSSNSMFGALNVEIPSMRAEYVPRGSAKSVICSRLDAAFVLDWMTNQGVEATLAQAEVIRRELEFHGDYPAGKGRDVGGLFRGWSGGAQPWHHWNPWWYWPVALPLLAAIWTGLAFTVRPRAPRDLPYAPRA